MSIVQAFTASLFYALASQVTRQVRMHSSSNLGHSAKRSGLIQWVRR